MVRATRRVEFPPLSAAAPPGESTVRLGAATLACEEMSVGADESTVIPRARLWCSAAHNWYYSHVCPSGVRSAAHGSWSCLRDGSPPGKAFRFRHDADKRICPRRHLYVKLPGFAAVRRWPPC